MKDKDFISPVLFFIFGIIVMALVSGFSIRNYIKSNEGINKQVPSDAKKVDSKSTIFFSKPADVPKITSIKIYKSKKILEIYGDNKIIGRFKVGLGRQNKGKKEREGDNKTPEGSYYVCYINENSRYNYFFGISYPNIEDADNGKKKNLINEITYNRIKIAIEEKRIPPWHTILGGEIGIHGGGKDSDWTYGCIALDDEDINKIKGYIKLNTHVNIYK